MILNRSGGFYARLKCGREQAPTLRKSSAKDSHLQTVGDDITIVVAGFIPALSVAGDKPLGMFHLPNFRSCLIHQAQLPNKLGNYS